MSATDDATVAWSRHRLLVALTAAVVVAVMLIAGFAYTVIRAFTTEDHPASTPTNLASRYPAGPDGVRGLEYRNAVAAAPMLQSSPDDMEPAAPALDEAERIRIGPSTALGPADVPTGFDHSPEGAVAQLAAIEVAALTQMSLDYARIIHDGWALAGARFDEWEIARAIQSFHASAGTVDGGATVSLAATPVGAQIKGTDGPDWVVACVQLDIRVSVVDQVRFGYGHCERMQYSGGRWMIAPGSPPAPAPSTWPKSQRSIDAGWRTWVPERVR